MPPVSYHVVTVEAIKQKFNKMIVCPGCGWYGEKDELSKYGQCPYCGYENSQEPFRLLTLAEISHDNNAKYANVRLNLFLKSVLSVIGVKLEE